MVITQIYLTNQQRSELALNSNMRHSPNIYIISRIFTLKTLGLRA